MMKWKAEEMVSTTGFKVTDTDDIEELPIAQDIEDLKTARLIASAPLLLEALKMAQKHLDMLICMTPTGKQRNQLTEDNISILQAVAKAEGK